MDSEFRDAWVPFLDWVMVRKSESLREESLNSPLPVGRTGASDGADTNTYKDFEPQIPNCLRVT